MIMVSTRVLDEIAILECIDNVNSGIQYLMANTTMKSASTHSSTVNMFQPRRHLLLPK
jgi:hypothetical protein